MVPIPGDGLILPILQYPAVQTSEAHRVVFDSILDTSVISRQRVGLQCRPVRLASSRLKVNVSFLFTLFNVVTTC
jgi:hypothetical protein